MLNPSLIDVLKENEKVEIEEYPSASMIMGFIDRPQEVNIIERIENDPDATQKEKQQLEILKVYLPAIARFKEGELQELFERDIEDIVRDKEQRGTL
jgi:uncharacterized protein YqeY|tara:strand:+ start:1890 stop:2180 length:291 start_codon:yes stop_codon:yes gene_type:complete